MPNQTIEKFGYPHSLVREFDHWVVLVRPMQPTLGSLVLAAKSPATAYGDLPQEAFAEQGRIVAAVEHALRSFCAYERINYLMLMMVDPNVHFHVIPRHSEPREWNGTRFADVGWPGSPDLKSGVALKKEQISGIVEQLRAHL